MKKLRNLSLVLAGFALGITVAYTPQIQAAASSLLGSKVGSVLNVKIDNKSIGNGAVINGATYVPLRAAANAMGMEVTKVDGKEVALSSGSEVPVNNNPGKVNDPILDSMNEKTAKINKLTTDISDLKLKIKNLKSIVNEPTQDIQKRIELYQSRVATYPEVQSDLNYFKGELSRIEKAASDAQTQIDVLNIQLTDLEAQLAALQK